MNTQTLIFNIRLVTLSAVVAGMLLSIAYLPLHTAAAQTQDEDTEETYVSEELVQRLEELRALVEKLVALVEQVRGSRDTGSIVRTEAGSVGENIVRVFVGNDLETIRYRNDRDDALSVCMDAVTRTPIDEGYGTQDSARCTYNGETIYSGTIQSEGTDGSRVDLGGGSGGGSQYCAGGTFRYDETGDLVCVPLNNYALEADSDEENGPDLFIRESFYDATASNVTISYALENDGAAYVGDVDVLVEVDASCDDDVDFRGLFTTTLEGGSLYSGQYRIGSDNASIDELVQTDGCYRMYVDYPEDEYSPDDSEETDGDIDESDENNNLTNWLDYSGTSDVTNES